MVPFASLKKQAETLFRLICCERKILFRLICCQEDILMVAELYYHIESTTQTIIILSSMSWGHMTK